MFSVKGEYMSADLETILVYLQRRYNILREVCSLTEELAEAVERGDTVSVFSFFRYGGKNSCSAMQTVKNRSSCRLWETAFRPGIYEIWLKVH